MGNSACVHYGGADVIDELLLNELLAIVDGVEDFADGERRGGVAANQAKTFLQLGRRGIFEPEEMIWLELFSPAGGLRGGVGGGRDVGGGEGRGRISAGGGWEGGGGMQV